MNFQDRLTVARELLVVQAMCRSAESKLGIENVDIAVVAEHVEQARKRLRVVALMLQPPPRVSWKTKRPMPGHFNGALLPAGTDVTLVDPLDQDRDIWIAEAHLSDDTLVGGYRHEILRISITADLE